MKGVYVPQWQYVSMKNHFRRNVCKAFLPNKTSSRNWVILVFSDVGLKYNTALQHPSQFIIFWLWFLHPFFCLESHRQNLLISLSNLCSHWPLKWFKVQYRFFYCMSIVLWEGEITGYEGPKAVSPDSSDEDINCKCNGYFYLMDTLLLSA